VAVGYDMRPDSKSLAAALIKGVREQGRDVVDIGMVSSDMIYFATGYYELAGGVVVTASHNPGDDNGMKLCQRAAQPISIETGLAEIRDAAVANQFPERPSGKLTTRDTTEDWINHVLSFIDPKVWPNYHIAIDAGNGMYGAIGDQLEKRLPITVEQMYYTPDGTFPNHIANPMDAVNLKDLKDKVISGQLDFGVAFDGDGDRAVLIDENGQALNGTTMTAIIAKYMLTKHAGAMILYNAVIGRIVPEMAEQLGGKSFRTRVGHSFIKQDMIDQRGTFAGEGSGHYFFADNYNADSGLIAAMIAIQVLAESGKTLSQLAQEYQKYPAIEETNFRVADKDAIIAKIKADFSDGVIDELDGVTVNYPEGWINVRASNTEPVLRLNAEAIDQVNLDKLVTKAQAIISATDVV
jgi:phosphomannomutase